MPLPAGLLSTGRKEFYDWRRKQGKCQGVGVRDRELARDVPLGILGLYEQPESTNNAPTPSGLLRPPTKHGLTPFGFPLKP